MRFGVRGDGVGDGGGGARAVSVLVWGFECVGVASVLEAHALDACCDAYASLSGVNCVRDVANGHESGGAQTVDRGDGDRVGDPGG